MKKVLLLNLLLFLCLFFTNAQEIKVYGKVIDKVTKEAISYATVVFNKNSMVADKMGNFSIQSKGNKNHLKITAVGYEPYTLNDITNFLLVELQRIANNLPEAVVYAGGESILEKAYERIPDNYYFNDSAAVLGIQQTLLLINDSDFIQIDTALLAYSVNEEEGKLIRRLKLFNNQFSRVKNMDDAELKRINFKIYNVYSNINTQPIYSFKAYKKIERKKRNPRANRNKKDYSIVDKILLDGRTTYIIEKETDDKAKSSKIYFIDSSSYAFVKVITQASPNKFERIFKYPFTIFMRGETSYKYIDKGKWVLNNRHLENIFYAPIKESTAKVYMDFVNIGNPLGFNLDSLLKHNNQYDSLRHDMDFLDINSTQTIALPKGFLKNTMSLPAYNGYFTTPPIVMPQPKNNVQDFSNPIKRK